MGASASVSQADDASAKAAGDAWPRPHLFYVHGLPHVEEETSVNLTRYRAFSIRSDDTTLFRAYWAAFQRDFAGLYELANGARDPMEPLADGEHCVVLTMKREDADRYFPMSNRHE